MKFHYISPYSREKNIGGAINDAISCITAGSEDWIVLTDHDILFLLPDTKAHIEQILEATTYGVLGCMTNRIGVQEQLFEGEFIESGDISLHMEIAKHSWKNHGDSIKPTTGFLGAFMLCFRVSVWQQLDGFKEKAINFDKIFVDKARFMHFKIGIMEGIYCFHLYRWGSTNPRRDIAHLL